MFGFGKSAKKVTDIDMEDPEISTNPLVRPPGHEDYKDEDIENCPVMSGKIPGVKP